MKTTPVSTNRIHLSLVRSAFFLIPLLLVCFALSPQAQAVCQDGCLTNDNTVLGDDALLINNGFANTAVGDVALRLNTTGSNNTANGAAALANNSTGSANTAIGWAALLGNTGVMTGSGNTATGFEALLNNTTGGNNTATGAGALSKNRSGNQNTATGDNALLNNKEGSRNIALGSSAGINLINGNNNIYIGDHGRERESSAIHIGMRGTQTATYIAGISGATVPDGVGVIVDADGHLGTVVSSERFKDAIQPMEKASEAILALKPVTFRYKHDLDPEGIPQFGLVAEEVEKVNPDLVARDTGGKAYTVRYEAVNAMLLNEFLKEHRKVEELEAKLAKQEKNFTARLKEQDAKIQRVNDKMELSKPAPQIARNNH